MAQPCGWWIKNITFVDKEVYFYIGIANESWSIILKNASGITESSTLGYSYGDHSLTATSYGLHTLELTCDWSTTNPCETCSFTIPTPCTPNWQVGEWEACQIDNTQIRTVTDLNDCNIDIDKPETTQSCIYTLPNNITTTLIITSIGLVIIYFLSKRK